MKGTTTTTTTTTTTPPRSASAADHPVVDHGNHHFVTSNGQLVTMEESSRFPPPPPPPPIVPYSQRRRLTASSSLFTVLPWFVGLIWTSLHPIVSVITGELKCRGSYVDEHGLDVHRHRVRSYPLERWTTTHSPSSFGDRSSVLGMCESIFRHQRRMSSSSSYISPSVECITHVATESVSFDVVRILPSLGPMIEMTEAVILVVGGDGKRRRRSSAMTTGGGDARTTDDDESEHDYNGSSEHDGWYEHSDMNASVLHMIQRLGNKIDCPWLNKVVYIVSPSAALVAGTTSAAKTSRILESNGIVGDERRTPPLVDVVDAFVASYLGGGGVRPLPPDFTSAMMRSLLVLNDVDGMISSSSPPSRRSEVRILPQGAGGALPNLDLVFATHSSLQSHPQGKFEKSKSMYYGGNTDYRNHPFGGAMEGRVMNALRRVGVDIIGMKDSAIEEYARDLAGLFGFIAAMAIGPRQPHSSALNHGIDALTIEVRIPYNRDTPSSSIHPHYADLTRCMEHLLRSVSNLHERLHHSIAQYTMPSPTKFVSHGEYIYPAILVSLPMVIRAATLALIDLRRFQFAHVGVVLLTICSASLAVGLLAINIDTARSDFASKSMIIAFIGSYFLVILLARRERYKLKDTTDFQGSLRFAACLVGIYLHAPLLLANYSLGFPSSAFWSPLLATLVLPPSTSCNILANKLLSPLATVAKSVFLMATTPPILLVPRIFHSYTLYVSCVYTPLHLLLAVLWLA